mgnify:CR=1 FL=1
MFFVRNIVLYLCIIKLNIMKAFNELTGYNTNKFVKENHVFIQGEGTFYETKELAIKYGHDKMIFVGVSVGTYIHEGVEVFRTGATNVWD